MTLYSSLTVSECLNGGSCYSCLFPGCSFQAADVDGEINLATCFNITDYPAQKDCGFQIHVSSIITCDAICGV